LTVRIKICGITSLEDAEAAVCFGAHALGFILVRKSPRFVEPEKVRQIISRLPPFVQSVGIFVNEDPGRVSELIEFCGLDLVQFHGEEPPDYCRAFGTRAIKAFRVRDLEILREIEPYVSGVRAVLLDSFSSKARGGTGKAFDWDIARKVVETVPLPVILAGGLGADTVQEAIHKVRPFAVDVSSGVEKAPGKKDKKLVKKFTKRVKEAAKGVID